MSTTNRSQDQDRLEGLEATGRVSPGEAAALREALEQHAERSPANDPAAEVELSKLNATARAFLSGAIDEPTLRKRATGSLLLAAVLFNLFCYVVWALLRKRAKELRDLMGFNLAGMNMWETHLKEGGGGTKKDDDEDENTANFTDELIKDEDAPGLPGWG